LVFLSDGEHVAAIALERDVVLQQVEADLVRVAAGLVDLVDRHDQRHLGRLGVADRLDRLRLDAVVGGHDQDDDVRDRGAARAHRGEGLVAGRVEEGDAPAGLGLDLVGADVLRDAAGLVRGDVGLAQRVEQRRLAVVDMAHDRHDGRARQRRVVAVVSHADADLDVGLRDALELVAELADHDLRRVGVDRLVDGRHDAHLHERLHDVGAALGHAVGELLHRDRLGDDDLAHDLGLRQAAAGHALAVLGGAPLDRGERAGAELVVVGQRLLQGHLAHRAALVVGALEAERRLARRDDRHARAARTRLVVLLLGRGGARGAELGDGGLGGRVGRPAALRVLLGLLAARLFLGLALLVLGLGAQRGLDPLAVLVLGPAARLVLGAAARLLVGGARGLGVLAAAEFLDALLLLLRLERALARGALLLGEDAQHGGLARHDGARRRDGPGGRRRDGPRRGRRCDGGRGGWRGGRCRRGSCWRGSGRGDGRGRGGRCDRCRCWRRCWCWGRRWCRRGRGRRLDPRRGRGGRDDALLLHLDLHGLGAPVREALAHLTGIAGAATQLQARAWPGEAKALLAVGFLAVGHRRSDRVCVLRFRWISGQSRRGRGIRRGGHARRRGARPSPGRRCPRGRGRRARRPGRARRA
jgi:hypothetical protein